MFRLFFLLLLATNTTFSIADVLIPAPPKTISASEINNANPTEVLLEKISTLLKNSGDAKTSAKIILADEKQIILVYNYTYGWRATDYTNQTLIYQKTNQDWNLTTTLEGSINPESFIGDLNGDGISELIVVSSNSFRNTMDKSQKIMLFDTTTKQYVDSNLIARSMATLGECYEMENTYENISIKKSAPLPIVIITKEIKKVSKSTCSEAPVNTINNEYLWSAEQGKFLPLVSDKPITATQEPAEVPVQDQNKTETPPSTNVLRNIWNWLTSWLQ